MMSSHGNLGDLETDLILEILSRLPAKSIARCLCVSKLWVSILTFGCPYFTELFLTHSKTRPRLLFTVQDNYNQWYLYSCPQPQISSTNSKSSISVTAEFHISLPTSNSFVNISPSVLGLMYFYNGLDLNNPTLCNPSTRHLFSLPKLTRTVQSYFGYDPINKEFNVLAISYCRGPLPPLPAYINFPSNYQILKLGSGKLSWRSLSLNCPLHHYPLEINICINGILYYLARLVAIPSYKIVCFDLNSEEFKIIDQPCYIELLVNFNDKLGVINGTWVRTSKRRSHLQLSLWVLEDIEKQEWSKQVYDILPTKSRNKKGEPYYFLGLTTTCDIVLTTLRHTTNLNSISIYFVNLEKKTLQEIVIKGFEERFKIHRLRGFRGCVDYVEELRTLKWS